MEDALKELLTMETLKTKSQSAPIQLRLLVITANKIQINERKMIKNRLKVLHLSKL